MRILVQHGACSILACKDSDTVEDLKSAIERQIGEHHYDAQCDSCVFCSDDSVF